MGSSPNSIAPTARKRPNILDFERRAGSPRNLTDPCSGTSSGPVDGLSTVVVGTKKTYPQNQPKYNKWGIVPVRTAPSVGDCASPSAVATVRDSGDTSPSAAVPDSPPSSVLQSCTTAIASRVIGLPRASELPPRTIRTCSVDRRVSSSNSWDADTDADAELTADRRSMSSEGWGERV